MAAVAVWVLMASSVLIGCWGAQPVNVTRHYHGDSFMVSMASTGDASCRRLDWCAMQGRRAVSMPWDPCRCQCLPSAPIFRQDIGQCVNSIVECGEHLASFVGPTVSEPVPLILLPDDNELIQPTAEIALSDPSQVLVGPNICELQELKALGQNGWTVLAQLTANGPVFKAVGGDGKLFLQFSASSDMRQQLYNSLVLVTVFCRREPDAVQETAQTVGSEFCIAFRVAPGISALETAASQKPSDYVILGLCAGLLGVTYIGAVLIYLLVRWQRRNKSSVNQDAEGGDTPEEGNCQQTDNMYAECLPRKPYENLNETGDQPIALPEVPMGNSFPGCPVEKLPTKDVHVEVGMEATQPLHLPQHPVPRPRLYFDPAFLDPEMLATPPAAALNFLQRLREMVEIAQTRLHQRRFLPALDAIPEEDQVESQVSSHNADDDRFTFLARIPEEGELVDSLAGLYDFDTFRHEMVSKLQRQRRSAPRTPPPPDDWVDEALENDSKEEQEEQTLEPASPATTMSSGNRFSRAQMLRRVFETEANGTEAASEESFDSLPSDVPTSDPNEEEVRREREEPNGPPVIGRTQQLATYVFGEALLSRMANGSLRGGSKHATTPPTKPTPLPCEFSPPKLEKVRRKVFGHMEQESTVQCKPSWDRLNFYTRSSHLDTSPDGSRRKTNGYGDVVAELRLKAPPPPSSPSDNGYQSSSDSERSPSSLGHPLKLLRRLLGPRSGSGRRKSHVTRVTLGEWLAQDDGSEEEELVVNFAGEKQGETHAHTLEGSIELGDEEETSTASDDADSLDGRVSALR